VLYLNAENVMAKLGHAGGVRSTEISKAQNYQPHLKGSFFFFCCMPTDDLKKPHRPFLAVD